MSKTEPHWLGPSAAKYNRKLEEWAQKEAVFRDQIAMLERLLGALTVRGASVLAALDDDTLEALCDNKDAKRQAKTLDRIRHAREAFASAISDEIVKIADESAKSSLVHGR